MIHQHNSTSTFHICPLAHKENKRTWTAQRSNQPLTATLRSTKTSGFYYHFPTEPFFPHSCERGLPTAPPGLQRSQFLINSTVQRKMVQQSMMVPLIVLVSDEQACNYRPPVAASSIPNHESTLNKQVVTNATVASEEKFPNSAMASQAAAGDSVADATAVDSQRGWHATRQWSRTVGDWNRQNRQRRGQRANQSRSIGNNQPTTLANREGVSHLLRVGVGGVVRGTRPAGGGEEEGAGGEGVDGGGIEAPGGGGGGLVAGVVQGAGKPWYAPAA